MTKLYVANPSNQDHLFLYTLPEVTGHRQQHIRLWAQEQIAGELSPMAVETIVEHHVRYGMVREGEKYPVGQKVSLVYQLDRPVKDTTIRAAMAHNEQVMIKQGQEAREAAAIVVNNQLEGAMFERRLPDRLQQLEMSIQEDVQEPKLAEGIRVTRAVPTGATPARRSRRGN